MVLMLATTMGCDTGPELAPVSGRVTLGGEPAAQISVTFQPQAHGSSSEAGPSSTGITDADGRYTLKTIEHKKAGAAIGRHVVRLARHQAIDPTKGPEQQMVQVARRPLPKQCRDGSLTFTVEPGGTDAADFDLPGP
jgi:hypothetical protein